MSINYEELGFKCGLEIKMLMIKRIYKYFKRNFMEYSVLLAWVLIITSFSKLPDKANWPIATITTAVMIYMVQRHDKKEQEHNYIQDSIRLLHNEYKRNINLAIILDQQKSSKIDEIPFSIYSTKYMSIILEKSIIKDKNLKNEIEREVNRLTWFNKIWLILAKEVLLDNKNLKNKIKDCLEYNKEQIYQKLKITKDLIGKYYKEKFCEILN